mgnify:FL=1
MSNFEFLKQNKIFNNFSESCIEAENGIGLNTVTCSILCRRALELGVKWLYANDNDLKIPYQNNLSALVHDITFKNIIDEKLLKQIEYIIKLGNYVVHNNKKISREEAILSLRYLYNFMQWIAYCYADNFEEKEFDESILQTQSENILAVKERESLYEELKKKNKKLEETRRENEELRAKLTKKREKKEENYNFEVKDISEYETRKKYIDLELKLAGWDFDTNITEELKLTGMPNNKNEGYADYVLFGKNGLPLAVVEAKRTSVDPRVGQNQAKLYADCIENEYHQRPAIYYTNGFEIYMWDDKNYPPRKVSGFYTQDELQLLVNRRTSKQNLEHVYVQDKITNREYQLEAIKSVCETFDEGHRKALIVMATGTGKTRTAISIVDVLSDKEWVKNVLFLADRTVLVKQAKNNFTKLLPNMSTCNLLSTTDNPEEARIVFSTYQTMMHAIDVTKNKEGNKLFTPGHFDLIIVDEAHRSIYKKYQAIFEYFDGLVVGLTATPRNDVDRNTYRFFEIENDVPTFAYEYEKAVKEGYLVDYHVIKTSTDFMDRGIKYSELSEQEKEEYENTFTDEEDNMPEEIESSAINAWLFNRDTIKKLLEVLMEKGLKVKGGDELGKTIIFARNHKHAQKIVDTFNELYPEYRGEFAKLVDNQVKYNETIIDEFSTKEKWPQIAVSVDMLDTGVDVPEILNLVFFKPVKSKIKFWQMIGRGTRLCKDLFGVGLDKKEFYIFDYCKNFEFFSVNPKGIETNNVISLTERIYGYKLDLIVELQNMKYQSDEKYCEYRKKLIKEFIEEIKNLNKDSFMVKNKIHYIELYSKEKTWVYISTIDLMDIKENLIPLFTSIDDNEDAKRFDNLMYQLQVKRIRQDKTNRCENLIVDTVGELEKLGTVPQIREKQDLILKVAETDYIKEADFWAIEEVRTELRNLIQFIDPYNRPPVYIDIEDTLNDIDEEYVYVSTGNNFTNYRRKVEKFLTGNLENVIVWKIRHNIRLTEQDKENLEKILFEELGNNKEYAQNFGDTNIIKAVRNIVGLDKNVVSDIFYKYINDNRLNMKQIQFVKLLIDYVIKNGTIDMQKLTEQPFKNVGEVYDLFGNNIDLFKEIREDIESINENAEKLA